MKKGYHFNLYFSEFPPGVHRHQPGQRQPQGPQQHAVRSPVQPAALGPPRACHSNGRFCIYTYLKEQCLSVRLSVCQ